MQNRDLCLILKVQVEFVIKNYYRMSGLLNSKVGQAFIKNIKSYDDHIQVGDMTRILAIKAGC